MAPTRAAIRLALILAASKDPRDVLQRLIATRQEGSSS